MPEHGQEFILRPARVLRAHLRRRGALDLFVALARPVLQQLGGALQGILHLLRFRDAGRRACWHASVGQRRGGVACGGEVARDPSRDEQDGE